MRIFEDVRTAKEKRGLNVQPVQNIQYILCIFGRPVIKCYRNLFFFSIHP